MPRNPSSKKWAIRITADVDKEPLFSGIENMCVIHHTGGKRSGTFKEKSHYHIYYEGDEVSYSDLKQTFATKGFSMHGNGDYSIKAWETVFNDWWNYVWKEDEKAARLVVWSLAFEQPPIPDKKNLEDLIYPEKSGEKIIVIEKKTPKQKPAHIRFYEYLQEKEVAPVSMASVVRHYVQWTGGNYALRYAKPQLQYAWYNINGCSEAHTDELVRRLMDDLPNF